MTLSALNSRRTFFKTVLGALGVSATWLADRTLRRASDIPENRTAQVTVPLSSGDAVRFHDRVIVVTEQGMVAVFSSACPHLGCRINRMESGVQGNQIVCPCHGSRFNLRGELIHGPAERGLEPLAFELDRAAQQLHVTVKS